MYDYVRKMVNRSMSLTEEQRGRLDGLLEAHRERRREREIARIKEQMSGMIDGFADKYEFADAAVSERLKALLGGLPLDCGRIAFDRLPEHRSFSVRTDAAACNVWFCSLCGSEEVFEVFVIGRLADFLADYDVWSFFGAHMLLVYEDFGGFVYIDDNKEMTEAFLEH